MMLGTERDQRAVEYLCQVGSGRDKNLSSGQGRKPDIGLEAVLAHEYDREAAAGSRSRPQARSAFR
jgi:hypothetical protein